MVAQLLVARGELAHDGPPVELQAVGLVLGQGATVEVKLELVGGPVKPTHHLCRKLKEAMGWNPWQKVLVLLLIALWGGVGGWAGQP